MALIVEVLDARGLLTRLRLNAHVLTVGRGYDNHIILDDAFADAAHARIVPLDDGRALVEDLGSINQLVDEGSGERRARIEIGAGGAVRVGRTVLRFVDPADPLPPALPDVVSLPSPAGRDSPQGVSTDGPASAPRLRPLTMAALIVASMASVALFTWTSSYDRSIANEIIGVLMVYAIGAALWAGVWALASRVVVQHFHFAAHLAVFAGVVIATLAVIVASEWLQFWMPDSSVPGYFDTVAFIVIGIVWLATHLAVASRLGTLQRWRAAALVIGFIVAVATLAALSEEDSFSPYPAFPAVVKPVSERWLPTSSLDDFEAVMRDLKRETDALVEAR